MKDARLATIWTILLPLLALPAVSCNQRDNVQEDQWPQLWLDNSPRLPVSAAQIGRLRIGMTVKEVVEALKPNVNAMDSAPILVCSAVGGGIYWMRFGQSTSVSHDDTYYRLEAVVFSRDAQTTPGRYVLPETKRGQTFDPAGTDE